MPNDSPNVEGGQDTATLAPLPLDLAVVKRPPAEVNVKACGSCKRLKVKCTFCYWPVPDHRACLALHLSTTPNRRGGAAVPQVGIKARLLPAARRGRRGGKRKGFLRRSRAATPDHLPGGPPKPPTTVTNRCFNHGTSCRPPALKKGTAAPDPRAAASDAWGGGGGLVRFRIALAETVLSSGSPKVTHSFDGHLCLGLC